MSRFKIHDLVSLPDTRAYAYIFAIKNGRYYYHLLNEDWTYNGTMSYDIDKFDDDNTGTVIKLKKTKRIKRKLENLVLSII